MTKKNEALAYAQESLYMTESSLVKANRTLDLSHKKVEEFEASLSESQEGLKKA